MRKRPTDRRFRRTLFAVACALSTSAIDQTSARQPALVLEIPIECVVGKDCFIQQYVDIDPGSGARDHTCGAATNNGHKGTDIRVLSTAVAKQGVPVVAAAGGIVIAVRNNMPDRLMRTKANAKAIAGRECGNGAVIEHGGGWQTQYCHLAEGSLRVRKGQKVSAGEQIGLVGYSGAAQFPHVHLTVRKDGGVVDPFTGRSPDGTCAAAGNKAAPLWHPDLIAKLSHKDGELIQVGFVDRPTSMRALEVGGTALREPGQIAPALIFFARAINLRRGDRLHLSLTGPEGFRVETTSKPLDRPKAQYLRFVGKRRSGAAWPEGVYLGAARLLRDGRVVTKRAGSLKLQ